jgi:hypothetical protein
MANTVPVTLANGSALLVVLVLLLLFAIFTGVASDC